MDKSTAYIVVTYFSKADPTERQSVQKYVSNGHRLPDHWSAGLSRPNAEELLGYKGFIPKASDVDGDLVIISYGLANESQ
jgi:hypothetical protein